jgi:hypothetical protein
MRNSHVNEHALDFLITVLYNPINKGTISTLKDKWLMHGSCLYVSITVETYRNRTCECNLLNRRMNISAVVYQFKILPFHVKFWFFKSTGNISFDKMS